MAKPAKSAEITRPIEGGSYVRDKSSGRAVRVAIPPAGETVEKGN